MRPTFTRSLALVAVAVLALSGCASKKDPTADGSTTATGLGKFGPSSNAGADSGAGFGVDGSSTGSAAGSGANGLGAGGSDLLGSNGGVGGIGNSSLGGVGSGGTTQVGAGAGTGAFADGGTGGFVDGGTYGSTGLIDGGVISAAPSGGPVYTDTNTAYTDPNATQSGAYNNALFDNNASAANTAGGNGGFTTYGSDAGGNSLSGYNFPGDNGSASYFTQQVGNRVLFQTDSVILDDNSRETLRRQAAWLQLHPEHSAILEGHADERGTREYNLALGSGRADSVRAYLSSLGVSASRLRTVSYGKERPISLGSGPSAWAQNRRVETVLNNGANF